VAAGKLIKKSSVVYLGFNGVERGGVMKKCGAGFPRFLLAIIACAFWANTGLAEEDLTQYGREWNSIKSEWNAETDRHAKRVTEIQQQYPEGSRRNAALEAENALHSSKSQQLSQRRDAIHRKIMDEANRRAARGTSESSKEMRPTTGTKPGEKGHRGMQGDLDAGAGATTADKVDDVLRDMGIKAPKKTTAGTIEYGDGLNLTINKEGGMGRAGSGAHQTQVGVDARNPETYVSEGMAKDQPGRKAVEVQDHIKKGKPAMEAPPDTLAGDPELQQKLAKSTKKVLGTGTVNDDQLQKILKESGINETPQQFKERMERIKEGRPQPGDITPENAGKIQDASRRIAETATETSGRMAESEIKMTRQKIADLEQAGTPEARAEARKLREQLVDSQTRIQETKSANREPAKPTGVDGPERVAQTKGPQDVDGSGKTGGAKDVEGAAKTGGAKDVDGPGKTGGAKDVDGPGRVADVDGPGKTSGKIGDVDGPGGTASKPGAADTPDHVPGKAGKMLDAAGKVIVSVDILSNAEDAKQAIKEGDMDKLRETAITAADGLVGGPVGTGQMVHDRLGRSRDEKNQAQDDARRRSTEAWEQEMRVDLRRSGLSKEEVDRIMDARAKGDEGPLKEAYEKAGKEIPKIKSTDPTWGETLETYGQEVKENLGEVADSLHKKGVKAKDFVVQTGKDLTEIGVGLTEKGVAQELIEQQKQKFTGENLKEGAEHLTEKAKEFVGLKETDRARENKAAKDLADKLIEKGVDPEKAREAASDYITHAGSQGSKERLRDLLDKTRAEKEGKEHKGSGENKQTVDRDRQSRHTKQIADKTDKDGKPGKPEQNKSDKATKDIFDTLGSVTSEKHDLPDKTDDKPYNGPVNDAGQRVDAGPYEQGDRVVTADGTEYEKCNGEWVKTGNNYGSYKPDGLRGAEPTGKETGGSGGESDRGGAGLSGFTQNRDERVSWHTRDSHHLMSGQREIADASTAGVSAEQEAKGTLNAAGTDAQITGEKSAGQTAAADRDQSWGKTLADGIQQGIEKGLTSAGDTFGKRAADKACNEIFKSHETKVSRGGSKRSSGDSSSPDSVAGQPPSSGSKGAGGTHGKGAASGGNSGGGQKIAKGTPSPPGSEPTSGNIPSKLTKNCPKCGKPMTAIVEPTDPKDFQNPDAYKWTCLDGCGEYKDSSQGSAQTTLPPPSPPPKKTKQIVRCPLCKSTSVTFYQSAYGPAYKCASCGGAIKAYAMIYETVEE